MLAFPVEALLATSWLTYVFVFSSPLCGNAEPAPCHLRDVTDINGVLLDLDLPIESNTEELVKGDQNKLAFETISLKDIF